MAGQPLSPATDRRLGRPLPHQLSNQTRAHPFAINLCRLYHAVLPGYAVLATVSRRYPPQKGRLLTRYSPVRHSVISENITSFDLHVLSTPPALILSQDQTLEIISLKPAFRPDLTVSSFDSLFTIFRVVFLFELMRCLSHLHALYIFRCSIFKDRFAVRFFAATLLFYHIGCPLSRPFRKLFSLFSSPCSPSTFVVAVSQQL